MKRTNRHAFPVSLCPTRFTINPISFLLGLHLCFKRWFYLPTWICDCSRRLQREFKHFSLHDSEIKGNHSKSCCKALCGHECILFSVTQSKTLNDLFNRFIPLILYTDSKSLFDSVLAINLKRKTFSNQPLNISSVIWTTAFDKDHLAIKLAEFGWCNDKAKYL